jgi:hypothetical protein
VTESAEAVGGKPSTAARIYDYLLGGTYNYPADRDAAAAIVATIPQVPALARLNRAFLRRSVRYMADQGVRQFLDLGSGMPTQGNVHEVVDEVYHDGRVVYVDIDPVAVSESAEILGGSEQYVAIWGDLRDPASILANPAARATLNFDEPIGVLLLSVLHFVQGDAAYDAVATYLNALAPGSHLAISHLTLDGQDFDQGDVGAVKDVYRTRTATPVGERTRAEVARFFDGLELVEPGVTWLPLWRPTPGETTAFDDDPSKSSGYAGVGRLGARR